jgi:hypothetical protein
LDGTPKYDTIVHFLKKQQNFFEGRKFFVFKNGVSISPFEIKKKKTINIKNSQRVKKFFVPRRRGEEKKKEKLERKF